MARQPDIQYIRYVTEGSAARKVAPVVPLKTMRLPRIKINKRITLHIDPLAFAGIFMSAVMIVLMAVGVMQLNQAQIQLQNMESYVQELEQENVQLRDTFEQGYDVDQIERTALALGLVPKEQVEHISVRVVQPSSEQEPEGWEKIGIFLAGLFA